MGHSVQTVDPVSGKLLFFFYATGNWYEYDPAADAWARINRSFPFYNIGYNCASNTIFSTIAAPVSNYGVNLFATYAKGNSKVFLYRHSAPDRILRRSRALGNASLSVYPNPIAGNAALHVAATSNIEEVSIFSIRGRRLVWKNRLNTSYISLSTKDLARGIYLVKALVDGRTLTARVLVK
jgi:hypothetical protein